MPRTVLRPRPLVPTSLDEALQLGRAVVAARLAPRGMETPEACMIAILHGLEVGLSPMQALQRIAVVNGRPTVWGDGALALVQASGLAVSITETVTGETSDAWLASCTVLRRGERQAITRTFSAGDAKRARLWGKAGPWSDYPQRMLQMRARAFALRDAFADVLGGLYLHEELVDADDPHAWQPIAAPTSDSAEGQELPVGSHQSDRSHGRSGDAPSPSAQTPRSVETSDRRVRRTAPSPPWLMTPTEASTGSVEDAKAASPQRANGLSPGSGPAPNSEPINPLPPVRTRSIDLRTRRPSATASRRRFNEHWDVRRPRALGEGKPRSVPTRRKPDPVVQDPVGGSPAQSEATSGDAPPASEGVFDENTLSLLDDALCCALDQATLDEIVEEFAGRLETLSGEDGRRAEAIMRRHAARVASLARQTEVKERGDG